MTDLVVIVPSRGRPEAMRAMIGVFEETCRADTRLVFAIDDGDPDGHEYLKIAVEQRAGLRSCASSTMSEALNETARAVVAAPGAPYAVAFMGDDHRPRTVGWDARYLDALRQLGTGIVYGNDLIQGQGLPTQVAMTADIVRALGWMAPPVLRHMYLDNFWRDLGVHAGCLRYLDDVVVEHCHPVAGTAEMDAGYERVNAPEVYSADQAAYREFCASGAFRAAVDAVRALRPLDLQHERAIGMARASFVAQAAYMTGARTVADASKEPTDLPYLLGPAVQVQHGHGPADVVCITGDHEFTVDCTGARALVLCGPDLPVPPGFTLVRTRTIGSYPVALAVAG